MNRDKIKGFFSGIIVTLLFTLTVTMVFASVQNKTIDISFRNIKLVIDGNEFIPKDNKGQIVEPFIYNGTTYLPVRAVGEAFGKNIQWVGESSTIYIGAVVQNMSEVIKPYYTDIYENKGIPFDMAGKTYRNGYSFIPPWGTDSLNKISFNLDGKYNKIEGYIGIVDGYDNTSVHVEVYVDDTLINSYDMEPSELPDTFSWNVKGALSLEIRIQASGPYMSSVGLGNVSIE